MVLGDSSRSNSLADYLGRVTLLTSLETLRATVVQRRVDAVVYFTDSASPVSARELARLIVEFVPDAPVLVRTSLSPEDVGTILVLSRAAIDVRVSLTGVDDIGVELRRLKESVTTRCATAELLTHLIPEMPPRSRPFGVAALVLGARNSTVGDLYDLFSVSQRAFRDRFAAMRMPAHRMLGLSLSCHALRLLEGGMHNLTDVSRILGFDDPDALSARVLRYTGMRPLALARATTAKDVIQAFARELNGSATPRG